jgi:hypothetical protein
VKEAVMAPVLCMRDYQSSMFNMETWGFSLGGDYEDGHFVGRSIVKDV